MLKVRPIFSAEKLLEVIERIDVLVVVINMGNKDAWYQFMNHDHVCYNSNIRMTILNQFVI